MHTRLRSFFAALLLCAAWSGALAAEAHSRFDRGLLWKVERAGAHTGYLYGTIHVPDARVLQFKQTVIQSIRASDIIATEIPMDAASLQAAGAAAMFNDGRRLNKLIGAGHYAQLAKLLSARGIPAEAVPGFKPWSAMSLLVMPLKIEHPPLDLVLFQAGVQSGKRTAGLETVAEQLGAFDDLPMQAQVAMLEATIDQHALIAPLVEQMLQLWLAEETGALLALSTEGNGMKMSAALLAANEMMLERIVDRRNVLLTDRLEALLKQGGSFAAVGALHLPGQRGMLNLLKQRGYTLERVH